MGHDKMDTIINNEDGSYILNGKRYEWYQDPSFNDYIESFFNYLMNYVKEKEMTEKDQIDNNDS